jgi:hypothetical protein
MGAARGVMRGAVVGRAVGEVGVGAAVAVAAADIPVNIMAAANTATWTDRRAKRGTIPLCPFTARLFGVPPRRGYIVQTVA